LIEQIYNGNKILFIKEEEEEKKKNKINK